MIAQEFNVDTVWTKTFGGSSVESGWSGQQTIDGGYIILARTDSYGNGDSDAWLIKTDSQGNEEWNHTYGGVSFDLGISLHQTTDSGYVITGWTLTDNSWGDDVWLIKTDTNGDTLWTQTFGGSGDDRGRSVQQTTDGGYIITGSTVSFGNGQQDVWLINTDSNGDSLWTKTFGGSEADIGHSVKQTTDGGYIITVETDSYGNGNTDVWLIKTDPDGDSLWTKTFGGSEADIGHSLQQTDGDGYIIVGETRSFGNGQADVWLIKTDTNGDSVWTQTFGGSDAEEGYSVQQTTDGGYIITGLTRSFGNGNFDVWLIKTDSNGDSLWTQTFGGDDYDKGHDINQTSDGGYIITGNTSVNGSYDVWLLKVMEK